MIERITVLGGSSVYTPEFVLSVISRNVNVKEIVLVGQSEARLELVRAFCQRLIKKSGFPAQMIGTTDVREAVTGAKYILNHVRVGGMKGRIRDEMLPPKFGMIGDEALGAGGFAKAMRTLPTILEHAKIIEEVNPGAIFINLSNPMGIIVEALLKYTKLNVLGVSELPGAYTKKVAKVLHLEPEAVEVDYVGLAHLGWIQDVKVDNQSRMSKLLDKLQDQQEEGFDYDLIELFRMIPTRNTGIFFHRAEILKKQKTCSRFHAEVLY
jgi:6-phospho-beta-glucosidase